LCPIVAVLKLKRRIFGFSRCGIKREPDDIPCGGKFKK